MGLDTTHNAWHGSYTGFTRWRTAVAIAAGWTMGADDYYTVPEDRIPDMPARDGYDNGVWLGDWPEGLPADPLDVLLVHSDCEGIIPWRFCQPIADRLTYLLPELGHDVPVDEYDDTDDWREVTIQFITGLVTAHYRHEDIEFF